MFQELCVQYWPTHSGSPDKMGDFTVELLEESSYEDYITRDIKLTQVAVSHGIPEGEYNHLYTQVIPLAKVIKSYNQFYDCNN